MFVKESKILKLKETRHGDDSHTISKLQCLLGTAIFMLDCEQQSMYTYSSLELFMSI